MIRRVVYRILDKLPDTALGRWKLSTVKQANWKVDMANVDHCGTCSAHGVEYYSVSSEQNNIPDSPGVKLNLPNVVVTNNKNLG